MSPVFIRTHSFERTSAAGYSIWGGIITVLLSGSVWLILNHREKVQAGAKFSPKACAVGAATGAINKVANFILVLALVHVDASIQYPAVTGGVIIVSTLICLFGDKRPSRRELISVAIAFLGTLLLFVIPF